MTLKDEVAAIRDQASLLFEQGASGEKIGFAISQSTDSLLLSLLDKNLKTFTKVDIQQICLHSAVVAVGGSGRGKLAPYSDTDLLFLYRPPVRDVFTELTSCIVRDCWDASLKLGHSLRTVEECLSLSKTEIEVATALVESRLLWGDEKLFEELTSKFHMQVTGHGKNNFIRSCIDSRNAERAELGMSPSQLEPNVKCSAGGLRDLHLVRWISFAQFGTTSLEQLLAQEQISEEHYKTLTDASEFLMRIRINMHLAAQREQDVLTRDDQLRITAQRDIAAKEGQRSVEVFMQDYFQQSTAVADFCKHFEATHLPQTLSSRISRLFSSTFPNGHYRFAKQEIDIPTHLRETFCGTLDQVLRVYRTAALHGVVPTSDLTEEIKSRCQAFSKEITPEISRLFLDILRCREGLGEILRNMYATGLLEIIIPDFTRTRCLLQFNQYHSYTVDEHTLLAVESAISFDNNESHLGTTYSQLKHREILHLALLLHDLGKGFEEDHSDVGKRIAERIGVRLHLNESERDQLTFLVHQHLMMTHLAFRRDLNDPAVLHHFTHEVGSAETLRMLYVLSAADLTAVGPGVFTNWKEELLTDLFDRSILILSGKHSPFDEEKRLEKIKQHVIKTIVPLQSEESEEFWKDWIARQLDSFAPHYLGNNTPHQIASDLQMIQQLNEGAVNLKSDYDAETEITEYTVIAHPQVAEGCFHRLAGLLTARRLEILSAEISTTLEGTVVDRFRVLDRDFSGEVPEFRQQEIIEAMKKTLIKPTKTSLLFQQHMRFSEEAAPATVSNLPLRVVIDNDTSQFSTIIDIFAHDRRGLLYTIARALHKMNLSIILAKISTHFDQVVDAFYIKDHKGRKIVNTERLETIREELLCCIEEFEEEGYLKFSS